MATEKQARYNRHRRIARKFDRAHSFRSQSDMSDEPIKQLVNAAWCGMECLIEMMDVATFAHVKAKVDLPPMVCDWIKQGVISDSGIGKIPDDVNLMQAQRSVFTLLEMLKK